MNRARMLLAVAAVSALLAGCSTMGAPASAPSGGATTPSLEGSSWVLAALPGHTPDARVPATVSFELGRAVGSDGCNRFSVPFTSSGGTIDVSARAAGTQMACPPDVMQRASAFMAALTGATSYRVAGSQLQLLDAGGAVLATLAPQSRTLAGTNWQATGINNGRNAVVSLVAGSAVTLQFGADGRLTGSAGCNNYSGGYQADGSKLRITAPVATRRMCAGTGVMEQEAAFLKALEAVTTMRMEGNRLELRDAQGALQVTATRDART